MDVNSAEVQQIRPFGPARSTIQGKPLSKDEIKQYNDFFSASLYLCLGMIYLKENPLLREPLKVEHIKARQLGHFGSTPGQIFTYMHFNRLIKKYDLDAIFISGPGHGAPAVLSQAYLEGTYSEVYPEKSESPGGMQKFFKYFSFPGGTGSHATPEVPGSIHEGGELGYSISHAFGTVFDNPNLISLPMVGDGEAETGPLATAWHSNKFLNPICDGAVLPVLHLNGYKINNPTVLARITHKELEQLMLGYGWEPYFVEGDEVESMHQAMAATLEHCVQEIRKFQKQARASGKPFRPRWPMIVLRTPKGWTGPRKLNGHYLSGFWRAHQVPITDVRTNPDDLKKLEDWMRSYEPDRIFGEEGRLNPELRDALCPKGNRRMSANPVANGGILVKPLKLPDFKDYGIKVDRGGAVSAGSMKNFAAFLRDIIKLNPNNFRLWGPDETESNKLSLVYEAGKKVWMGEYFEEDSDGGNLSPFGRVMEVLSEHTCEGWLEGYILSGRHGLFNSYEPFIHIVDSMVNQVGVTIQVDPGFLGVVANKSPAVVRIYLPPDGNCLLSTMDHCLRSFNYVNVVVADKQEHLQYLSVEEAIEHCSKGIGIWQQFSTDDGQEPDVVMACCGDISTQETLAAIDLLLQHLPDLKIRCVNVVDLFKLIHHTDHPHGLEDSEWTSIFTADKPIIFNFHSYPWLVHRLTYKRPGSHNIHVRGYREKGNIDTPLELAIRNQTDRFSLAMDAIDRMPHLHNRGASAREKFRSQQQAASNEAYENGTKHLQPPHQAHPKIQRAHSRAAEQRSRTGLLKLGKREEVIQGDPYALYPYWAGNVAHPRDPRMFDIMEPIMRQLKSKITKKTKEVERIAEMFRDTPTTDIQTLAATFSEGPGDWTVVRDDAKDIVVSFHIGTKTVRLMQALDLGKENPATIDNSQRTKTSEIEAKELIGEKPMPVPVQQYLAATMLRTKNSTIPIKKTPRKRFFKELRDAAQERYWLLMSKTERAEIRRRAAAEDDEVATWLAIVKDNWQANWAGGSRDEDHFYNYLVDHTAGQSLWELIEEDIFVATDAHRRVLFANVEQAVQLLYDNETADLLERCINLWSFFTPLPAPETSRHVVDSRMRRLHPELDMERATVETLPNAKMAVARDPQGEHPFASWLALFSKSADQEYPRRLCPGFCQAVFGKATNFLRFLVQPLAPRFYAESREVRENLDDWCKFATDEEDFITLFVLGINGYTQRHRDINDAQGGMAGGNLCVPQLKVKVRYQPGAAAIIAGDMLDHLVLDYTGARFFIIGTNHDSVKQRVYRKMGKLPPIPRAEEDDDVVPADIDSEDEDCDEYGHLYEDNPKAPPLLELRR
ncbi:hypothetical protein DL765_001963 [Monosporascus sp. GIB2]|nr:hypothetical protein DL765_001963 [Monosporascus sp. GIB2]